MKNFTIGTLSIIIFLTTVAALAELSFRSYDKCIARGGSHYDCGL